MCVALPSSSCPRPLSESFSLARLRAASQNERNENEATSGHARFLQIYFGWRPDGPMTLTKMTFSNDRHHHSLFGGRVMLGRSRSTRNHAPPSFRPSQLVQLPRRSSILLASFSDRAAAGIESAGAFSYFKFNNYRLQLPRWPPHSVPRRRKRRTSAGLRAWEGLHSHSSLAGSVVYRRRYLA